MGNIPGPGQYTPAKTVPNDTSACISAPSECLKEWKENTYPGPRPGSYEGKSYITSGNKHTMGVPRAQSAKRSPGPGHYDPQDALVKAENYSLGRCRTGRLHRGGSATPGPGQYDNTYEHSMLKPKSPQCSIMPREIREMEPRLEPRPRPF